MRLVLSFFGPTKERTANLIDRGWISRLFGCAPQPTAEQLATQEVADREAERRAFCAEYQVARADFDTRRMHATWPAAFAATCDALRAEAGR